MSSGSQVMGANIAGAAGSHAMDVDENDSRSYSASANRTDAEGILQDIKEKAKEIGQKVNNVRDLEHEMMVNGNSDANDENNNKDEREKGDDDDADKDEDDDDEDEEVFLVESILDHRSDFEDGQTRYLIKWQGYEKKSDQTWETEENLAGAKDTLNDYWRKIGGKPQPGANKNKKRARPKSTGSGSANHGSPGSPKRRKRQSVAEIVKSAPKSQPAKRRSRVTSNMDDKDHDKDSDNDKDKDRDKDKVEEEAKKLEQDADAGNLVGITDVGNDSWRPPIPRSGSWDPLVQSVDTVVRDEKDQDLWGFLIWKKTDNQGKHYRSKSKLDVVYTACPQRMLKFYEKHLVFTTTPSDGEANGTR